MPCRLQLHQHREMCRNIWENKTEYACIVDADESMMIRMEGVPHIQNLQFVTFIPSKATERPLTKVGVWDPPRGLDFHGMDGFEIRRGACLTFPAQDTDATMRRTRVGEEEGERGRRG